VDDRRPGIRRRRRGRSFVYVAPDGSVIRNERELARIRALAVPPAYTDVWICPIASGHLQATGRDARGRKQYRYHKRWREVRDEAKYERLVAFARALPAIRRAVERELVKPGVSRTKVLATAVRLLDLTGIRIGNEEYAESNDSFGLTTLRRRHVRVNGSTVRFRFRGKTGREHLIALDDARIARILKRCRDLPGEELFAYVDDDGSVQSIASDDVNEYIRSIAGTAFSAKDFRTWIGTVECLTALGELEAESGNRQQAVKAALERVARRLGNTPAICRKAYVHPAVIESYLRDIAAHHRRASSKSRRPAGLTAPERRVLAFIKSTERATLSTEEALRRSLRSRDRSTN
jgi:DNA topoisomerase I